MENKENDLISGLPDEILRIIVSGLDMKEAARTSVLSHRWRHVWKFFSACLDFESKDTLRLLFAGERRQEEEAQKFSDWVYDVMDAHKGPTVDQLRIVFPFPRDLLRFAVDEVDDVTMWLWFAMLKKVQKLELDMTSVDGCYDNPDECYVCCPKESAYTFRSWLLDIPPHPPGYKELGTPLHPPPSFKRLTALSLKSVSISESDLARFLTTCSLLEQLLVENASSLKDVRVSGTLLKLKHLGIRHCVRLKNIEVSATSLASFAYAGPEIKISFTNVPKLTSIALETDFCETFVLHFHSNLYFSQLKNLELDLKWLERTRALGFPRNLPEFINLEELELKFVAIESESLLFLSPILAASPKLQKLKLKYVMDAVNKIDPLVTFIGGETKKLASHVREWEENARTYTYQCLRVIQFVGWVGLKCDVQLANYLIESASADSLEKIIFDLRIPHSMSFINHTSWAEEFDPDKGDREAALRSAMEMERKLPPGAQLIIV